LRSVLAQMAQDSFLKALDELERVLAENAERARLMERRIAEIREWRAAGHPYAEIVTLERPPLIVQLLTESAITLDTAGATVRRLEAQALYREGLTMDQIAAIFGVTRQRVSALLRHAR
jgi:hypothetical protein